MELRIDPSFPPAFERLRKAARKKSHQVRDALTRAAREGKGLPQKDKLTLPWKQHKRTVYWIRIDRATRLMYEQDGDVQILLYVGRHQEAETFLRNLPAKASGEESLALEEWLRRTAPPASAARADRTEKERKPTTAAGAQRQLIQALENLLEDCLLNMAPAVVEEYASPQMLDLERRLAEIKDRLRETARAEQQERSKLQARLDELQSRLLRLDQALGELAEQIAGWKDAAAESADELRRLVGEETSAVRESQIRDAAERLRQMQAAETRFAELHQAITEIQSEARTSLDEAVAKCRADLRESETRQRREAAEAVETAHARFAGQDAAIDELRQTQQQLQHCLAALEQQAAENHRNGMLSRLRRLWK